MTTIRQLIQSSPTRANELFAKLVDTSDNAVKTREKLFAELKEELETLAALEEQHLFPVLRKHKQTKDLVREALNDNKQARKLLADLEATPKDSEDFAPKVVELKRLFQQHVRDEKKELLPAVLKALSDEEAEEIVERIEGEKAEIEQAKRAEAEQRRAEAREQRDQEQSLQRTAESIAAPVRAGAEGAQRVARTVQDTAQVGFGSAAGVAQRAADQLAGLFGLSGQQTSGWTERSSQVLEAMAETTTTLTRSVQELSRECVELSQERLKRNIDGLASLAECRSIPDFLAIQSELVRDNLQRTIDNSRRVAELSVRVAEDATRTMSLSRERDASKRVA
jgi:hypothetical protein